jgi:carbonic anhydrase/acetyltransferase-like protein (isoleucine patch superfamily)
MILPYKEFVPKIDPSVFIAPGADVIGRVHLAKDASIWFGSVLRGDVNEIHIGEGTNIQDGSILHVDDDHACLIGGRVHVGHHVNLHACRVEDGAMIGIGAIVLSGVQVGAESIIGSGSVVLEGTIIPPRSLAVGIPARVVRSVTDEDLGYVRRWVEKYILLAQDYKQRRL